VNRLPPMDVPRNFHFRYRRMVEFADTDMAGLMHFANFLKFAECAEHAFFRSLGHRVHTATAETHEGWPRLEVSCKYRRPARFEETLEVCLRLEEIRTSSLTYSFWIFLAGEADPAPIAHGTCATIHVAIAPHGGGISKSPIPPELRAKLDAAMKAPAA
jgi:acyl-CoA thioester hydrolase